MENTTKLINCAWEDRSLLTNSETIEAVERVLALLDVGKLRVVQRVEEQWLINDWVKKAIILYFIIRKMETMEVGMFEFYDKIPLKHNYAKLDVRVVPHAIARYGSYLSPGVILMPSYVNIGAYVGSGTMVDTWATVG
ncbi:MAG: 2,3,4,5-tetrahydropyridine-2,6-dicarboxylate N-succinyltransferase, partial [Bacteroidetes bacterium]|nr:2,3,4,5-tetrahydropyridine-2,6-dicarboxylate N-succinyltransferase [Bacteroidota bacterium]